MSEARPKARTSGEPFPSSFRCGTRPATSRRWSAEIADALGKQLRVRDHLRQRRLDRRHRSRADAADGEPPVAAPCQACRHPAGSRRRCAAASCMRARPSSSRSTATGRTIPPSFRSCSRRCRRGAARRPRRRPAGRPQGHRLQEVAVAHRQRGAQRDPARRHARHRLRPQGVPPRSVPGAAVFRRAASLHAGAGAARGLRDRLCGRDRPAAPRTACRTTACGTGCGSASSICSACGG